MIFLVLIFIFLLKTNGKKGNLDENDFRHCYGNFSKVSFPESYLITAMFVLENMQQIYRRTSLKSEHFYCLIIIYCSTDLEVHPVTLHFLLKEKVKF